MTKEQPFGTGHFADLVAPERIWLHSVVCTLANCALTAVWSGSIGWRLGHIISYAPFILCVYLLHFSANRYIGGKRFWGRGYIGFGWALLSIPLLFALIAILGSAYYAVLTIAGQSAATWFWVALIEAGGWLAVTPAIIIVVASVWANNRSS